MPPRSPSNRIFTRPSTTGAIALSDQAKTKAGADADALFAQAGEKYAVALAIKPDDHEVLNNWGDALSDQAKTKIGEEAARLSASGEEKRDAARTIKSRKS